MSDDTPYKQTNIHGNVVGSATDGGTVNAQNIAGRDVNITQNYVQPAPPEKPTFPIHQIAHPPNPNFIGREQILQQVAQTLAAGQTTVVTQTIAGLGGVGKTQLALAYSYAHLASYDLIYWLSADSEPGLGEDLMSLARRLKLVPPTQADQQAALAAVQQWLGQTSHKWLLVYDNADQIEPAQLTRYLPRSGSGHVLITSRNPNYGGVGKVLELGLFSLDEAVDFLFQRKGTKGAKGERGSKAWEEAAGLAEALGRLPLALEHAAAYVESKGSNYVRYHQLFSERKNELWQRAERPEGYHATITTTWELAFDEIKRTRGALDLLNLCCFLDPECIPLDLIKQLAMAEPSIGCAARTRCEAPLHTIVADELGLDDAIGALRRYSLVQRDGSALSMHRLVQSVARMQMGKERAQEWVMIAVDLLAAVYNYDSYDMSTWISCGELMPHLTTATNLGERYGCETNNLAKLNKEAGYYLRFRGNYLATRPHYERALAIRENVLGSSHPDTARSLNDLGYLLRVMGDLAGARLYYERALTIQEETMGPNHPDTAESLTNMGYLLRATGDFAGAQQYYERTLAIREKALSSDHPDTARSLTNIGYLLRITGDLAGAQHYYERALAIREKALGPDHPDTARSLNNLGYLLRARGDLPGARLYYQRALAIREKVFGQNHPDTARSLNNLGGLLEAIGDLSEALPLYERALSIREKALGPDHADTASSFTKLSALLQALGDLLEARPYLDHALAIYEKTLGPDHPHTKTTRSNLTRLEEKLNESAEL